MNLQLFNITKIKTNSTVAILYSRLTWTLCFDWLGIGPTWKTTVVSTRSHINTLRPPQSIASDTRYPAWPREVNLTSLYVPQSGVFWVSVDYHWNVKKRTPLRLIGISCHVRSLIFWNTTCRAFFPFTWFHKFSRVEWTYVIWILWWLYL